MSRGFLGRTGPKRGAIPLLGGCRSSEDRTTFLLEDCGMTTFESIDPPAGAGSPLAGIEENPPGGPMHNAPLGTLVLRAGLMPQHEIESALQHAVHGGRRLGEVLMERGLGERELVRLLAAQRAQPFVDLSVFRIDPEVARLLPPGAAEMYCAIPIARQGDCTLVAVPDADNAI